MKKILKIGLPKGSLQEATFKIFQKAGFNITVSSRSYIPSVDDAELDPILIRAQEMSRYVEDGALDCGITGDDWIRENNSSVRRVEALEYAKQSLKQVRWVIAVPESSSIRSIKGLKGKRIATELVGVTKNFLKKKGVKAEVEFSWGATEVKVAAGLVDAIVEVTETGASLRANNLRIIDTVCSSTTQLIANKSSWNNPWKKGKMEAIAMLLKGAIVAGSKVGLKMNVSKKDLASVLSLLPAMKKPTISVLAEDGWFDIDTIIDEEDVKRLIPALKRSGAQGIIEYPLNKAIY
ncbi:MAG: ATP phosphoribosyltransferase [Candidatus Omnitrophica bacterium]|nr:ATP phosphoribosyltransferase [Candidatus Omnitrophota bacterium]